MKVLPILIIVFLSCSFNLADTKNYDVSSPFMEIGSQPDSLFKAMKWRNIGPTRGGRVTAVSGVIQDPFTFYFGSTGGGVWKTRDGGATWLNISDGYFRTGSVGAIAVAPSDPNVIYVGMGEAAIRGVMTSHGDGVYKSTDAGETWEHIGLGKARQISRIAVHPDDPDVAFVGVQGSPYAPTEERGVYRTLDGGSSWERILFVDSFSGVSSLSMDPNNSRVLYAAFWDHQRMPWKVRSGGPGSGIWKTSDSGESWTQLSEGLPDSLMGKIGVVVSPASSSRVYAIIESQQGGLYRSDNSGRTWKLINEDRVLRARSWYYMHIFAHPTDPDHVVVLNAPYMYSLDGGKSFQQLPTPHGDNHDLWFHPDNPMITINGNDGGANVSYNGGRTWSTQQNQPTAQFYRVNADNRFPYYVYGGQQDNSTVAVPSAWTGSGIPYREFYPVGGCESAYTAFDPDDPRYVYAGCYQGIITRYDTELRVSKDIMAYPDLGLGQKPATMKYRFNWNAPIIVSEHDRNVLYHAGNKVLKSEDQGQSWTEISPDLTRNTPERLDFGGGPITNEGAGGENYHTIMYLEESPLDDEILWAGTDDGLIYITRDGGNTWSNITPPEMKEGLVNSIDASSIDPGKAYIAFTRYKFNDFTPHIFITGDHGKTWRRAIKGIADEHHVRVVRHDPERESLLFAGTEAGLYISFDDGRDWRPFQLNLPITPITDLMVHRGDLIAATQGRAFWILDDLTPVRHWQEDQEDRLALLQPREANLWGGVRKDTLIDMGTNPEYGMVAFYRIPNALDTAEVQITILDESGNILKEFSNKEEEKPKKLQVESGLNKLVWNLRPDVPEPVKGLMTFGGNNRPRVLPGTYQLRLMLSEDTLAKSFEVIDDPRLEISASDQEAKAALLSSLDKAYLDLLSTIKDMAYVKEQLNGVMKREEFKQDTALISGMKQINGEIDSLDSRLVQRQQKTFQDVINFPNQLDAKIKHIQNLTDNSPPPVTEGQVERVAVILAEWEALREAWQQLRDSKINALNEEIRRLAIPFISTSEPGKKTIKP